MVFVPKQKRKKWDAKSEECVLTGFDEETKGYRLYNLKSKTITISREVNFINEGEIVPVQASSSQTRKIILMEHEEVVSLSPNEVQEEVPSEDEDEEFFTDVNDETSDDNDATLSEVEDADNTVINLTPVLPPRQNSYPPRSEVSRRSGREHILPGKYKDFVVPTKGLPSSLPSQKRNIILRDPETSVSPTRVQHPEARFLFHVTKLMPPDPRARVSSAGSQSPLPRPGFQQRLKIRTPIRMHWRVTTPNGGRQQCVMNTKRSWTTTRGL